MEQTDQGRRKAEGVQGATAEMGKHRGCRGQTEGYTRRLGSKCVKGGKNRAKRGGGTRVRGGAVWMRMPGSRTSGCLRRFLFLAEKWQPYQGFFSKAADLGG